MHVSIIISVTEVYHKCMLLKTRKCLQHILDIVQSSRTLTVASLSLCIKRPLVAETNDFNKVTTIAYFSLHKVTLPLPV